MPSMGPTSYQRTSRLSWIAATKKDGEVLLMISLVVLPGFSSAGEPVSPPQEARATATMSVRSEAEWENIERNGMTAGGGIFNP